MSDRAAITPFRTPEETRKTMWPTRRPAESQSPAPARRALRRGIVPAALAAALALTATACGGGGDKAGGAPSSASPAVSGAGSTGGETPPSPVPKKGADTGSARPVPTSVQISAYNAFAQCMRRHGIDVPDAGRSQTQQPEPDPTKAQNAMNACAKELSKGMQTPR